jgi:S-adenosylmethionine:tRNA ribosyltransferase-isomerase
MRAEDYDFPLPERLIAGYPPARRDSSRLLVLRRGGRVEHRTFTDLPGYLEEGDMLLLNKTKVLPVRLRGRKPGGGELEMVLVKNLSGNRWEVMSRGRYSGLLEISEKLSAEIHGGETAELRYEGELKDILWETGEMPLPPYIKRRARPEDKERYQTVYAEKEGSIAAPTAGLHFTRGLLESISLKGVLVRYLTLHVGRGTFTPMRTERVEGHRMEEELFEIDTALIEEIKQLQGRLIAVGTTTTRAVEGLLSGRAGPVQAGNGTVRGSTDIFIYPGYVFRAVKGLVTNFHLPRSTPLMLVSALAGREKILNSYGEAIGKSYRFFSYGDAMLII